MYCDWCGLKIGASEEVFSFRDQHKFNIILEDNICLDAMIVNIHKHCYKTNRKIINHAIGWSRRTPIN